jgi:hypothetical protein
MRKETPPEISQVDQVGSCKKKFGVFACKKEYTMVERRKSIH